MSSQWYEAVTKASTTFGNYVEDILGTKLARALPNNVILLPSDKVKLSLLLIERLSSDIYSRGQIKCYMSCIFFSYFCIHFLSPNPKYFLHIF